MVLASGMARLPFGFATRIKPLRALNKERVNRAFTMLRQGDGMSISPASGAPSQTQLAVLEQIRAMRAAKAPASVQAPAPVPSAAPVQMKPAAAQPAQALATATATPSAMPANRPRGSILNIVA
jgi:hypothetical protein